MTVRFETTKDDIVRFNYYHLQHAPNLKRMRLIGRLGVPVISMLIVALDTYVYEADNALLVSILPWALIGVIWLAGYPAIERWGVRRQVKLQYKGGQNKQVFGACSITLSADSVLRSSEYGDTSTRWDGIERIEKSSDFVVLYNGTSSGYFAPSRAFESEESMIQFFEEARSLKERFGTHRASIEGNHGR